MKAQVSHAIVDPARIDEAAESVRLELAPSWRILLYTDGVLEATIGGSSDGDTAS